MTIFFSVLLSLFQLHVLFYFVIAYSQEIPNFFEIFIRDIDEKISNPKSPLPSTQVLNPAKYSKYENRIKSDKDFDHFKSGSVYNENTNIFTNVNKDFKYIHEFNPVTEKDVISFVGKTYIFNRRSNKLVEVSKGENPKKYDLSTAQFAKMVPRFNGFFKSDIAQIHIPTVIEQYKRDLNPNDGELLDYFEDVDQLKKDMQLVDLTFEVDKQTYVNKDVTYADKNARYFYNAAEKKIYIYAKKKIGQKQAVYDLEKNEYTYFESRSKVIKVKIIGEKKESSVYDLDIFNRPKNPAHSPQNVVKRTLSKMKDIHPRNLVEYKDFNGYYRFRKALLIPMLLSIVGLLIVVILFVTGNIDPSKSPSTVQSNTLEPMHTESFLQTDHTVVDSFNNDDFSFTLGNDDDTIFQSFDSTNTTQLSILPSNSTTNTTELANKSTISPVETQGLNISSTESVQAHHKPINNSSNTGLYIGISCGVVLSLAGIASLLYFKYSASSTLSDRSSLFENYNVANKYEGTI